MNFTENLNIKGHLTISKITPTGEELVFDDKNIIVSGFGWGLAYLFARLGGSTSIVDYQIDRVQLGVSGHSGNQVSSTFQLSGPLSSVAEYTTNGDSNVFAFSANQWKNAVLDSTPRYFAKIPFSKVTKVDDRSVRYTIFIDEDSCNSLTRSGVDANLNEIGLFMKNPLGVSPDGSVLVAYRYFTNIRKTSDFGLLFRWTITLG